MPRDDEERTHGSHASSPSSRASPGVLLCGLVPLLPVKQTTATIVWPQASGPDGLVTDITAPLVSGAPLALDVSIPCQASPPCPPRAAWCSRPFRPPASTPAATACSSAPTPTSSSSRSATRSRPSRRARRWQPGRAARCTSGPTSGGVGADFIGIPGATGRPGEKKPQVAGVFTDLEVAAQPGLSARIDVDTRFITSPTALKLGVMVLGVACVLASIVALAVLDRRSRSGGDIGRVRAACSPWRRFWRVGLATWLADVGVVGTLLLWHVIGATLARRRLQPDDRAGLGRGRATPPITTASSAPARRRSTGTSPCSHTSRRSAPPGVWMRLPATLAGIATWLILSRWVLPRLGRRLAANRVTVWTGGAVFLAAWLPFNNGLRPEPLIAFGVVAAWVLVEIRDRRPPAVARGGGDRGRDLQRDAGAAGPDRAGPAAGGRAGHRADHPHAAHGGRARCAGWPRWPPRCADLRDRVPRPDAGHGRRVGAHQIRCRPDHRLVSGVPALLLPHRRGQRRLLADPPLRRAGAAAVPVRHARGPAARGRRTRYGDAARSGG